MRIQVLVDSRQARAAMAGLGNDIETTKKRSRGFGLPWMSKWGNQVQWAGRQLIYNFTLPLALAGTAATNWALENEKAMTRVAKVYGDGSKQFNRLSQTEIPALAEAFEALSNRFGVHQAEVINIGADWAAAGASGIQLAKAVKLTLETMVLGEIEAAEATKNLIAIQAQYGQDINQLSKTIDVLNMVENQTGASMRDLMEGMARAAGVARESGVDVEHLGAMIAALTPAAGSAANAGNGLKTIISRILSPTSEAKDLLREMGVQIDESGWNSLTATQRIEQLADEFVNLSDAQKTHMATVIGSRWQLNRIIVLMRAVRDENSYYNKSLRATSDEQAVFNQKQRELQRVMESNPQRIKQTWVIIQNAMTDVIVPLLPYITYLASKIAELATGFSQLSIGTQKWIIAGLIFLALIGPIARYVGSVTNLVGLLIGAFHGLGAGVFKVGAILYGFTVGPLVSLIAGLGSAVVNMLLFVTAAVLKLPGILARALGMFRILIPMIATIGRAIYAGWVAALALIRGFTVVWWTSMTVLWSAYNMGIFTLNYVLTKGITATWLLMTRTIPVLVTAMMGTLRLIFGAATFLMNPMVLAVTGGILVVIGILHTFRDQIASVFSAVAGVVEDFGSWISSNFGSAWNSFVRSIVDGFWALPTAARDALLTVLRIVQAIAIQIYEWLSYLNPFARHSPSLVDNVTRGMDAIVAQFARTRSIGSVFQAAYGHLARFSRLMGGVGQFAEDRKTSKNKGLFDAMIGDLRVLYPLLRRQEQTMQAQEGVVDRLQERLDGARDRLQRLTDAYQRHEDAMQRFADAPIKGMGAFNDKLFDNEMAQKRLQLRMMKWEQTHENVDQLRDRLGLLQGDIEELTGRANDLRMGGAGSNILGPINDQIAALESQAKAVTTAVRNSPVSAMQDQLEQLQAEGSMLQLQYDIKYDPLIRQIEQLADAQKELSYDQIVDGINKHKAAMDRLRPSLNDAQKVHDRLENRYATEKARLDDLRDSYQKTNDVVSDLESSLRSMGQAGADAAKKAKAKVKAGKEPISAVAGFRAAAGGNWPDPGGMKGITRKSMKDQSALIRKFADEQLADMNQMFDEFDMFGPLKDKWNSVWGWIKSNVGPTVTAVGEGVRGAWTDVSDSFASGSAGSAWDKIVAAVKWVVDWILKLFALIAPDVRRIFEAVVGAIVRAWEKLGPAMSELFTALRDLWESLWPILRPLLKIIGGVLLFAFKILASVLSHLLGPAFDFVVDVIRAFIKIVTGIVRVSRFFRGTGRLL
jgi:TP901 family phage tail tape measure protein